MNSSAITPFYFGTDEVRVVTIDNEPWFVARDICDVLDLEHITNALSGLEEDELTVLMVQSGGQNREMKIISESGLYNLIFKSRKPEAKKFRKWVTAEVLPTIRKTGSYSLPPVLPNELRTLDPDKLNEIGFAARSACLVAKSMGIHGKAKKQILVSDLVKEATGYDLLARLQVAGLIDTRMANDSIEQDWLGDFVDQCLDLVDSDNDFDDTRFTVKEMYRAFIYWWREIAGKVGALPQKNTICKMLRSRGYEIVKRGGEMIVYGVTLKEEFLEEIEEAA